MPYANGVCLFVCVCVCVCVCIPQLVLPGFLIVIRPELSVILGSFVRCAPVCVRDTVCVCMYVCVCVCACVCCVRISRRIEVFKVCKSSLIILLM